MALFLRKPGQRKCAEFLGLTDTSLHDERTDLRKVFQRGWVISVLRSAEPDAVLIELDTLRVRKSEHHTAKSSVSYRQRLFPALGRGTKTYRMTLVI